MTARERIIKETKAEVAKIIEKHHLEVKEYAAIHDEAATAIFSEKAEKIIAAWKKLADLMNQLDDDTILQYEGKWITVLEQSVSQMTGYSVYDALAIRSYDFYKE